MRVAPAVLAIFAACGRGQPARVEPAWTDVVAAPVAREAAIDVGPAELGDDAAVGRMRHRVRMKRIGRAWLRGDAAPINDGSGGGGGSGAGEGDSIDELMPVIGETANRIRVVTEEDGARVAVWIDRRDAWESIVALVKLDGGAGAAEAGAGTAGAGVWLEAGAPVAVTRGPARASRGRPLVELRDEGVAIRGAVPAAFVGQVWIVPQDDRTRTDMDGTCPPVTELPRSDRRARMALAEGAVIRAAAGEAAPALATLRHELDVAVLSREDGWAEVELQRPYVRVRGRVPERALSPTDTFGMLGASCGGHGFGMSHADRIEVPAGTCLFDRANGDVIGVAIETQVRLGSRGRTGDEWSMVYVDTRWSISSLYVRDTGRDPTRPVLESCAQGQHGR